MDLSLPLLLLLIAGALVAAVASLVVAARDGYRREPTRALPHPDRGS